MWETVGRGWDGAHISGLMSSPAGHSIIIHVAATVLLTRVRLVASQGNPKGITAQLTVAAHARPDRTADSGRAPTGIDEISPSLWVLR